MYCMLLTLELGESSPVWHILTTERQTSRMTAKHDSVWLLQLLVVGLRKRCMGLDGVECPKVKVRCLFEIMI